jgi:hypothetical protein
MLETIRKLARLPAGALLNKTHKVNTRYHESQWQMAVCLRAIETSGAYQEKQVGNAVEYAVQILELTRQKATELLRVARVLESCPLLSEAFRLGEVKWGKIREVTRVVTPETEAEWLEYAKAHDVGSICAQVSMSPSEFKRQRALKESLERQQRGETGDFPGQMALPLPVPQAEQGAVAETPAQRDPGTGGGIEEPDSEKRKGEESGEVGFVSNPAPALAADSAAVPAVKPRTQVVQPVLAPPTQPRIRLTFDLTPEDYAVYEKAAELIRSRTVGRIRKEGVLKKMCEQVMTSAPRRAQIRYQVLVHYDLASQTGA